MTGASPASAPPQSAPPSLASPPETALALDKSSEDQPSAELADQTHSGPAESSEPSLSELSAADASAGKRPLHKTDKELVQKLPATEQPSSDADQSTSESSSMAIPLTPRTRRVGLLAQGAVSASPGTRRIVSDSHSPSHARTPDSTRRTRRIGYITPSSTPRRPRRSQPLSPVGAPLGIPDATEVEQLILRCTDAVAGQRVKLDQLNSDVLQAIAAKERYCLELREDLAREESHLEQLRNAWQRMAIRRGVGTNPRRTDSPNPRVTLRPHRSEMNLRRAHADSTASERVSVPPPAPAPSEPSKPTPVKSSASAIQRPTPPVPSLQKSQHSNETLPASWRGFTRFPTIMGDHLSMTDSLVPEVPPLDAHLQHAAQQKELPPIHTDSTPPTPRAAADTLNRRDRSSKRSSVLAESWQSLQRQLESHLPTRRTADDGEAPPLPPKDDFGAEVADKLASGWQVLSKRVKETTASIADLSWLPEEAQSISKRSSFAPADLHETFTPPSESPNRRPAYVPRVSRVQPGTAVPPSQLMAQRQQTAKQPKMDPLNAAVLEPASTENQASEQPSSEAPDGASARESPPGQQPMMDNAPTDQTRETDAVAASLTTIQHPNAKHDLTSAQDMPTEPDTSIPRPTSHAAPDVPDETAVDKRDATPLEETSETAQAMVEPTNDNVPSTASVADA